MNPEWLTNNGLADACPTDQNFQAFTDNILGQPVDSFTNIRNEAYFDEWAPRNPRLLAQTVDLISARFDPANSADGDVDAFSRMSQR